MNIPSKLHSIVHVHVFSVLVLLTMLDACRAFDRVNFSCCFSNFYPEMFHYLLSESLLCAVFISWSNAFYLSITVSNGVKQGRIYTILLLIFI